ncbi:MAG: hypothetical protein QW100_00775 [Thermoplasmatales archaeon]
MIKDLEITSIEGKRIMPIDSKPQEIRIDQNLTIVDVRVEGEYLRVIYKFTSSFSTLGMISIEGSLLYSGDVEIEMKWKKDRVLPDPVASEIQAAIFSTCITETILVARDLRLPPPIPVPTIKKKDVIGFG